MKTKLIVLCLLSCGAFADTNICKWIFVIPEYPDMERAGTFSSHVELFPPFITRFKTYKPKEGIKVDKDNVIQFYKDFYTKLGWKTTDWKQESKFPYLQMDVMLNTLHSGEMQLWISPDGELLTIYMNERRVVHPVTSTFKQYQNIFESVAEHNDYYVLKATSFGWEDLYENEYLQTCESYSFYHNSRKSDPPLSGCCDTRRRFHVILLLYKNKQAATEQKKKWDEEASHYKHRETIDNGDGTFCRIIRSWQNQIVMQDESILIKIDNRDESQTNLVSKIASEIKSYSNQNMEPTPDGAAHP